MRDTIMSERQTIATDIPRNPPRNPDGMAADTASEIYVLTSLLAQAGARIGELERKVQAQQARITTLETESVTDELTALRNRKGFFRDFERELSRVARGHSYGGLLLLIDIENYQAITQVHTHGAGNTALRLVGRTLSAQIRCMDVAARLGEASFVLLMADTPAEDAVARAQGLSRQLNHLSFVHGCTEISIHAAIGMRDYGEGDTTDHIFRDADIALHRRKNGLGGGRTQFRDAGAAQAYAPQGGGATSELTTSPIQAHNKQEAIF